MSYNKKDIEALAMIRPVETKSNHIEVDRYVHQAHVMRSQFVSDQITALIKLTIGKYRKHRRNEAAKQSLYAMTERELKDLGITRAEIDYVVEGRTAMKNAEKTSYISSLLKSLAEKFAEAQKARAGYAQLMAMDSRQLADIGLTRGDIESAVAKGHPRTANDNRSVANNNDDHRHAV